MKNIQNIYDCMIIFFNSTDLQFLIYTEKMLRSLQKTGSFPFIIMLGKINLVRTQLF